MVKNFSVCSVLFFLLISIVVPLSSSAQQIRAVPIPSGQSSIGVRALSNDGSAVIGSSGGKCFRWYVGSALSETLPGDANHSNSSCGGVSSNGSIVGGSVSNLFSSELAYWSGSALHIATVPGLPNSQLRASCISAGGSILAGSYFGGDANYHPFRVSGSVIDLLPRNFVADAPAAMSADGQVLVGGNSYAVRWSKNGLGWVDQNIGSSRPGSPAGASDVNWNGDVVVGYDGSSSSNLRAFRWSTSGGMQALGLPSGSSSAYALAVSDDGNFVGGGAYINNQGGWRAMIWRQGIGWTNLATLLTSQGVNLTGWVLNGVTDVSGDGRIILGSGTFNSANTYWVAELGGAPISGQPIQFGDPNVFSAPLSSGSLPDNSGFSTARDPDTVLSWSDQSMLSASSVVGAAADGVTRLVVRWPVSGPGVATLRLTDENGDPISVGSLGVPGLAPAYTYLPSLAAWQVNGSWYVFASYATPSEFRRSASDDNRSSRTITVKAQFAPASGSPLAVSSSSFTLIRPPVLLLHGWASSASASWGLALQQDPRFLMYAHDYGSTSERSFTQNIGEPRRGVERLIRMAHHFGYAATQVVAIGHSMGGLLARLHAGNREGAYYRPANLGQGDFYKLITLYSPHYGSPVACMLDSRREWMIQTFGSLGICLDCGAVADLRSNSAQVATLPAVYVPTHVIAGVGGNHIVDFANDLFPKSRLAKAIGELLISTPNINGIWGGRHDMVVGEDSAYGPMPSPYRSAVGYAVNPDDISSPIGVHWGAGKQNYLAQYWLLPLLLSTRSAPSFAFLPANGPITTPLVCGPNAPLPPPVAQSGSITISQPLGSAVVNGGMARVDIAHNASFQPASILVVGDNTIVHVSTVATSVDVPVAADAFGPLSLSVVARSSDGTVAVSNPVTFNVGSSLTLTGLEVTPAFVPLGCIGDSTSLAVQGHFGASVTRDVSAASSGTVYTSANPSIARVDLNGKIYAGSNGNTTVTVRNGAFQSNVEVTVSHSWCNTKPFLAVPTRTSCPDGSC